MVFPIGDDNSDRTSIPVVNVALIIANVFVFVVLQGMGENLDFTYAYSTVPAEIASGTDIVTDDQMVRMDVGLGRQQEVMMPGLRRTPVSVYLTLFTAVFMHGGVMHLLGNMWFLWIFGDNIENDMGKVRYLIFYLVCGLLASLAHVMMNTEGPSALIPSLGASGAISGVMGAYLVLHPKRRVTVILFRMVTEVPGIVAVGMWFAFQILSSMMGASEGGGVAYAAHIGGFIVGAVLAKPFTFGRAPRAPSQVRRVPW